MEPAISPLVRLWGTGSSPVSAEPPNARRSMSTHRWSVTPASVAMRLAAWTSIAWRWPYRKVIAKTSKPSCRAMARTVAESMPPLNKTTALRRDPIACPTGGPAALGVFHLALPADAIAPAGLLTGFGLESGLHRVDEGGRVGSPHGREVGPR